MKKLDIRDSFWLMLAAAIFLDSQCLLPVFLSAAACHEAGHALMVRLCGGRLRRFRLSAAGGMMTYRLRRPSTVCDICIALSGPLAGLLLALAANAAGCYTMAGASLLLSLFNLLPIPPLDGGRVLDALLPSHPARLAVSYFASCLVICAGLYAGLRQNGWGLLLVGLFLTLGQQTGLHFHPIRGRIELLSEEK